MKKHLSMFMHQIILEGLMDAHMKEELMDFLFDSPDDEAEDWDVFLRQAQESLDKITILKKQKP